MSITFIIIATGCYILTFLSNLKNRDYPMALVWFSYSLANFGLIWYEVTKLTKR
jgi:hypothetical protein